MPTSFEKPLALKIQNLSKKYMLKYGKNKGDNIIALDNLSLDIYQGEIIGIIGPNGSGKSTMLKIISEVTSPDSGFVEANGKIASILEVGTGFNPDLSGRKNIYLNARLHGMKKEEVDAKFDKIVELFGFPRFLDSPIKSYSSGMYMRLAFAVVVNINADIYLFDEVLSVGDVMFRDKIIELIKCLQDENKTILFVTHSPGDISDICNKILLLNEGKKLIYDLPNEVLFYYGKMRQSNPSIKNITKNKALRDKKDLLKIKQTFSNVNTEDEFNIIKASVSNADGNSDAVLDAQKETIVEFECTYSTVKNVYLGFTVKNEADTIITTHLFDQLPSGKNSIIAKMTYPPDTFNETVFIIDVLVMIDDILSAFYQNIVIFKVESSKKYKVSWRNNYFSLVNLPVLNSSVTLLS